MALATLKTSKLLVAEPLTPELFEPFGGVMSTSHQMNTAQSSSANYGTATKLFKVSPVVNNFSRAPSKTPATANWNIFRCSRPDHLITEHKTAGFSYMSKVVERHPFSTQTFIPMGRPASEISYMVIVAPTLRHTGLPDIENAQAFTCTGNQAVTYGAATWHAPMIALADEPIDFAVLIHENGVPAEDCEEVYLDRLEVTFTTSTKGPPQARKPQPEEDFQAQLDDFKTRGPRTPASLGDVPSDEGPLDLMHQKDLKYAAERQYYLKNYDEAVALVDKALPLVNGKMVAELTEIKTRALVQRQEKQS